MEGGTPVSNNEVDVSVRPLEISLKAMDGGNRQQARGFDSLGLDTKVECHLEMFKQKYRKQSE